MNYRGGLYPVDFRAETEQARRTINAWVEEQTKGKIQDLLKPTHVSPRTLLVLTNAIYFKGLWTSPFSKEMTAPDDFHASTQDQRSRGDDESDGSIPVFRRTLDSTSGTALQG